MGFDKSLNQVFEGQWNRNVNKLNTIGNITSNSIEIKWTIANTTKCCITTNKQSTQHKEKLGLEGITLIKLLCDNVRL